jgi:hypothetical protein
MSKFYIACILCIVFQVQNVNGQGLLGELLYELLRPKENSKSYYFSTQLTLSDLSITESDYNIYYDSSNDAFIIDHTESRSAPTFLAGAYTNAGIVFGRRYSLGVGTGLERYLEPSTLAIPLYFNMRLHVLKNHLANFLYIDMGGTIPLKEKLKTMMFVRSGLSVQLYSTPVGTFTGLVNFELRQYISSDPEQVYNRTEVWLNGMTVGVGFNF